MFQVLCNVMCMCFKYCVLCCIVQCIVIYFIVLCFVVLYCGFMFHVFMYCFFFVLRCVVNTVKYAIYKIMLCASLLKNWLFYAPLWYDLLCCNALCLVFLDCIVLYKLMCYAQLHHVMLYWHFNIDASSSITCVVRILHDWGGCVFATMCHMRNRV